MSSIKRPHYDLIIAWANGAEIEWRFSDNEKWTYIDNPSFDEKIQYRVKPEIKSSMTDEELIDAYADSGNIGIGVKAALRSIADAAVKKYIEDQKKNEA